MTNQKRNAGERVPAWIERQEGPPATLVVTVVPLFVGPAGLQTAIVDRDVWLRGGEWTLPARLPRPAERLEAAAKLALLEAMGPALRTLRLEPLGAYSPPAGGAPARPVTVAWLALVPHSERLVQTPDPFQGAEVVDAVRASPDELLSPDDARLAPGDRRILADGVALLAELLERAPVATTLCGPTFTLTGLRTVYEMVWRTSLDPANFRRKVLNTQGFVAPVGSRIPSSRPGARSGGRPSEVYRAGGAERLSPPLLRPDP